MLPKPATQPADQRITGELKKPNMASWQASKARPMIMACLGPRQEIRRPRPQVCKKEQDSEKK